MPRSRRIKGSGESFYHIVTRVVDLERPFTEEENCRNLSLLRKVETFSAVQVVAFCLMSNHLHILLRVPKRQPVSQKVLLERMEALYTPEEMKEILDRWAAFEQAGLSHYVYNEQRAFIKRMYDMGEFMKTLKQRLTMSYNKRHGRKGTLWEERYKSILLEATPTVLSAVAAYIDLNPVRAGMVNEPQEYRFSSYGEASAGNKKAQEGLQRLYQDEQTDLPSWDKVDALYSVRLKEKLAAGKKRPHLTKKKIQEVLENHGRFPFSEIVRVKNRFFSWGYSFGRALFEESIQALKKQSTPTTPDIPPSPQ